MLLTAEPSSAMKKSSQVHTNHPAKPRVMPRREKEKVREASVLPGGHCPRTAKSRQLHKAAPERKLKQKENPETKEGKQQEQETEVKVKSTVVDIDSVREEEETEESLGLLETEEQEDGLKHRGLGVFEWLLMVFALTLVLLFLPLSIWFCVKVVREYERAVIFRLGHLLQGRPRGPGLIFYLPFIDVCHKVDIRLKMLKVPLHTVLTKDFVQPELSAVCYYQVENVALCSSTLSSLTSVLQTLVQAAFRDVLAQHTFSHILVNRRRIGQKIQTSVDSVVCHWGVRVERADIDELRLPDEAQQSLVVKETAKREQQISVNSVERQRAAWDVLRTSLHHRPALVVPLSPDILTLTPDLSALPPPPPPPDVEGEGTETDSPMM
ncbi:podocin [Genypterus blacodes]|uniref:podocin n=1 Tax=Genypterus blacodes TaxID=154954 RepID=UPI003F76CD33